MRLIFNTTYIVEENIETEWQDFMREQYIAYLRRQQFVQDVLFTKVSIDQPDGKTFRCKSFLIPLNPWNISHNIIYRYWKKK